MPSNDIQVAISCRKKERALNILEGYINGKAVSWTIDKLEVLEQLIQTTI
ncbi:hypothetical protein [Lutibacter sp.]